MLPKLLYFSIIVTLIVGIGYCDTTLDIHSPSHLIPREEPVSAIASAASSAFTIQSCPVTVERRSRISRQAEPLHCYQEDGNYHPDEGEEQDGLELEINDTWEVSITGLGTYQPPDSMTSYPNFRFVNQANFQVNMGVYNLRNNINYPTITMPAGTSHNYYLIDASLPYMDPGWQDGDALLFKIWWYDN